MPKGWSFTRLGDLCIIQTGKKDVSEGSSTGKYPFFTCGQEIQKIDTYSFASEAILVAGNGYFNVKYYNGMFDAYQRTYVLNNIAIYGRYLYYYVTCKLDDITKDNRGSTIRYIRLGDLTEYVTLIPPLNEQHRIVAKIEELFTKLDAGVEALKIIKVQLKQYRQAVLKYAFEGKLTEEWRGAHKDELEPASVLLERIHNERKSKFKGKIKELPPIDTSGLPELPEGWEWARIGKIFDVYVGATPSRAKPVYWGGKIPWVSSGEVAFCRIHNTKEHITELGLSNTSTNIHQLGTVLLGMIGEGKTRGQAAILDIAACNNQNSAAIRVSEQGMPPEYIYYFLEYQYEITRALGSGNNQPALNKSRVQLITFPLTPIAEQNIIVQEIERYFSIADELERTIDQSLQQAERLCQSILKKAFEGKLVPQDPNDEPAEKLLERIKAEKAAKEAEKKPRKRGKAKTDTAQRRIKII